MAAPPESLAIATRGALDARVRVPGSKSLTNRALVVAALASGPSTLRGGLHSDDTRVMIDALRALGCAIKTDRDAWHIPGTDGRLRAPASPLDSGNSGTTARFLTAAAALADGPVVIDGNARMRERPIDDLVHALVALGAECEILGDAGCPPLRVKGGGIPGGKASIDARRSSQYVSAILLAAPYAQSDVELSLIDGALVSRPYVELTLQLMDAFGAEASWSDPGRLQVVAGHTYRGRDFGVEPDASAAVYPLCAAAIAGGRVRVDGVRKDSLQADFRVLDLLERMGCKVERQSESVTVTGPDEPLHGIDIDMNDFPDAVLAVAVVALFAEGVTHIRNVGNLRIKETDRLAALETELRKLGAGAHAGPDSLTIEPAPLRATEIDTYDDHRMAMSLALAGLRVPGVVIRDPGCVSKTWPDYFTMLEGL